MHKPRLADGALAGDFFAVGTAATTPTECPVTQVDVVNSQGTVSRAGGPMRCLRVNGHGRRQHTHVRPTRHRRARYARVSVRGDDNAQAASNSRREEGVMLIER